MSFKAPPSTNAVHFVGPGRPRFVRICITPFAASVPYRAAADGPLTISIDSTSSGLKSSSRDGVCPPTPIDVAV